MARLICERCGPRHVESLNRIDTDRYFSDPGDDQVGVAEGELEIPHCRCDSCNAPMEVGDKGIMIAYGRLCLLSWYALTRNYLTEAKLSYFSHAPQFRGRKESLS